MNDFFFYLPAPGYRNDSVGVRAFHRLCHELNERGYPAFIRLGAKGPGFNTPRLGIDAPFPKGKMILVYWGMVGGNPVRADLSVKWLLTRSNAHVSNGDLVFVWEEANNPPGRDYPVLRFPMVDRDIFFDAGFSRAGRCLYAKKYIGQGKPVLAEHEGLVNLAALSSQKSIADILRKSEALICYENSQITTEAAFCGCPTIYANGDIHPGIVPVLEHYERVENEVPQMLDEFIRQVEARIDG